MQNGLNGVQRFRYFQTLVQASVLLIMKNPFSKLRNPLRRGNSKESVVEVEAPAAQSMEKSTYTDEHMITLEELYQVGSAVFITVS